MNRRAFLRFSPTLRRPPALPSQPTPAAPLPIEGGIAPYSEPLDRRRAAHLLRRTGFGASPADVSALVGSTADEAVDVIVDAAVSLPLPEPPPWVNETVPTDPRVREEYIQENEEWLRAYRAEWFKHLTEDGLRERLTLFWHNHFVTELDAYYFLAPIAYRYLTVLRTHALGNFKAFVYDIGPDPAMLLYLNGAQNTKGDPNENYARELLELFTMGQTDSEGNVNYTQEDIEEIARALTGWTVNIFTFSVEHDPELFDDGEKTIFGVTGTFDYEGVIDLIFEERRQQTAEFICRKLYKEFIYAEPDETFVSELAGVFLANDFEIAPVLRALLKSEHFFDEQVIGAQIKSPVALLSGLARELSLEYLPEDIFGQFDRAAFFLEQSLLDPPNVAGWEGHRTWISTITLPIRWLVADALYVSGRNQMPVNLVPLAEKLHDPTDPLAAFYLPAALAEHLMPVPPDTLNLNVPDGDFAGDLANFPIPEEIENGPAYVRDLAKIFLGPVPWYEWDLYLPQANALLVAYVRTLLQLPEFQLT